MNNSLLTMRALRLTGIADKYKAINGLPQHQRQQTDVFLAQLLKAEELYRNHRRSTLSIKNTKFRYQENLQEINFEEGRNLTKETISALSDCGFIDRGEQIIITGATGCGKRNAARSYLSSEIGHQACLLNKKVAYFSLSKLLGKIKTDKIDGAIRKETERIEENTSGFWTPGD